MPKETREKTGNQRNSTPYNVSNSSFAQRITSKVAQFIPTGWVSGWSEQGGNNESSIQQFATNQVQAEINPNLTQVQVEINHVDTPILSQSSKKSSLPNHNNMASNSNNRTAYASLAALGNETCSPILNSERHPRDYQAVGSSGFSQSNKPVQNVFVASTPAFNINKQPSGNGDNGSDSGESTSGCSSLVSQSNKLRVGGVDLGRSKSLFPNRQIPTEEITKSHNRSSGPHFDSTLFNSRSPSLNKSVNLSPFYPGRTMYGGAATYRKHSISSSSNKSSTSPSVFTPFLRQRASLCNQSNVNPSPITLPKMSVVAENILKTINAMTPVTRLMTMPRPEEVNPSPTSIRSNGQGSGVKRKLPELQIPTVVNTSLIHLKGSERKNMLSRSVHETLSSSSSSDEDLNYEIVSNDAKRSLKEKMKRIKRGKSRHEESQADTGDPVSLPNAVLNVPTLPVIDIPLLSGGIDVSFSDPVECQDFNFSSESSVLSISSNQDNTTSSSVNFMYNNTESTKAKPRASITLPPVEVSPNKSLGNIANKPSEISTPNLTYTWRCDICTNKQHTSDSICKSCNQPRSISIKQTDSGTSKSLSESFKPPPHTWECGACCVQNKPDAETCVCCTTPKPGATPAPSTAVGFGDLFKKPSNNWECPACMISNKSADNKCIACETAKPGSKPAASKPSNSLMSGPKFPFATSSDTGFKFGIDKVDAAKAPVSSSVDTKPSGAPSFSFGMPSVSAATSAQSVTTTSLPAFSFGVPKAQDSNTSDKKQTETSVSSSLTSPSAPSASPSPANSLMFKPAASETKTSSAAPVLNFVSPAVSSAAETVTNTSVSTPTFSFGNSNGPITKLSTDPVDVKAPESVKGSLFGTGSTSTPFLFGPTQPVNNTGANKSPVNSFGEKRVQFNLTNSNNSDQPPSKIPDFGKPATNAEPVKPLFGGSVFEKPKENNTSLFSFSSTNSNTSTVNNTTPAPSNIAPPPAFPTKPAENQNMFSFGTKPASTAFPIQQQSTPSAPLFAFGNATATPAPNPQPTLNSAFTFGASNNNSTPNFNIPPANQQPSMFGSTGGSASVFGATNNAQPAVAAPIFGSCGFSQSTPAQPAAASTPFAFGAPQPPNNNASMGFSFGTQNTAPVPNNNAGFSFGAPTAPPTFDPKMKPTFNFTSGAPTTFNAQPGQGLNSGRRIIKKAVRRK
uniref:Nuclear pore complex protein Nup153 n=1 Tax=Cacopsylla melanoneura TaxID=428564 RepID=A0A8D8LB40_9HEMI